MSCFKTLRATYRESKESHGSMSILYLLTNLPPQFKIAQRQDGLVSCVSNCHVVGRGFSSRPRHTIDHHKKGTNYLPAWHTGIRIGM